MLKERILERDFETGTGRMEEVDVLKPYVDMLEEKITLERPLKVVMDCGNAAAVLAAPEIFRRMGVALTELFCTVDGTFPNHHPDPTEEKNLQDLIAGMKTGNYDLGVAYDGDADRIGTPGRVQRVDRQEGLEKYDDHRLVVGLGKVVGDP